MQSSGIWFREVLLRTDVSEEHIASIIRVTNVGEQGTLAVTSNRNTLRRNTENGDDTFLRNVGSYKSHTVSYLRIRHSSDSPPEKPQIFIVSSCFTLNFKLDNV
jgi:hypothetical protein